MQDQKEKSPQLGMNTGSNFFNSSSKPFNPNTLFIDCSQPGLTSFMDKIVLDQSNSLNNLGNQQTQNILNQFMHRPRYGNHRNKTTRGFERANLQLALMEKQKQSNRYYKGSQVPCMPSQKHFYNFSPGIFLFFTFLKKASILFFILSLIYLIPILYNFYNGDGLSNAANTFQVIVGKMMVGNQYYNGDDSQSLKDKLLNILPDEIAVLIFLSFYIFWYRFSKKIAIQNKDKFKKISNFTIEVTNFSFDLTEVQILKHFQKYGQINQVAVVKNYEQMIDLSKQIYELCLQIKQKILSQNDKNSQKYTNYINERQKKVNQLFTQLGIVQQKRQKKNIKFYVRFQQQQTKAKVLKDYQPYNQFWCCFKKQIPEQLKIKNQFPKIKSCETQPAQIIWQNIHIKRKSRIFRFFIQFILILVIIVLGFIIITTINISAPPTSYTNIQTSNLTLSMVQDKNIYSLSYTWCLNKTSYTTDQQAYCQTFKKSYYYRLVLSVAITFVIIIIKLILKNIMIAIAYFQRYKNHTQLSTNIMTNLFIIYITTTVMITFLMQANIFGISFKNIVKLFITNQDLKSNLASVEQYKDFVTYWYKDIGYQIWLNWLILSIFPHPIMPLFYLIKQKIGQKFASKQVLQRNVKKWLQAQQFQIQDNYANILMLIFVGFSFSGGIPFMAIFTMIGLSTRYLVLKYIFIRFCRIPNYYTDAMNERAKLIIQISLIMHMAISIWMFGVSQILGSFDQIKIIGDQSQISKGLVTIINKLSANWYLSGIMVLIVLGFIFYKVIFQIIAKSCTRENKQQNVEQPQNNCKNQDQQQQQSDQMDLKHTLVSKTQSYKIEKNPNYFQILAIMKPQDIVNTQQINMLFPFINVSQINKTYKH